MFVLNLPTTKLVVLNNSLRRMIRTNLGGHRCLLDTYEPLSHAEDSQRKVEWIPRTFPLSTKRLLSKLLIFLETLVAKTSVSNEQV